MGDRIVLGDGRIVHGGKERRRSPLARQADQALPLPQAGDFFWPAVSDLAQLVLAAVDARHAADAPAALQVEWVRLDAGDPVRLEDRGNVPLKDRPVVEQPAAHLIALGQVAPRQGFITTHPLPRQDQILAAHQRNKDLLDDWVALQFLCTESGLCTWEASLPET